jgi:hypothetical protein
MWLVICYGVASACQRTSSKNGLSVTRGWAEVRFNHYLPMMLWRTSRTVYDKLSEVLSEMGGVFKKIEDETEQR